MEAKKARKSALVVLWARDLGGTPDRLRCLHP